MADVTEMQENEAAEVDPKAAKKAAKEAKKAAKKAKKEAKKNGEEYEEDDESLGIGGRLIMGVVVLLIILIWLVIFGFLVKMDVGG
ncbi:MAG: hypothetical protein J6Y02_00545, partial [Pseudobutyrivibrio sp.]|nr:hypothetical protein [Pseudobutyrivibrio sp.]